MITNDQFKHYLNTAYSITFILNNGKPFTLTRNQIKGWKISNRAIDINYHPQANGMLYDKIILTKIFPIKILAKWK